MASLVPPAWPPLVGQGALSYSITWSGPSRSDCQTEGLGGLEVENELCPAARPSRGASGLRGGATLTVVTVCMTLDVGPVAPPQYAVATTKANVWITRTTPLAIMYASPSATGCRYLLASSPARTRVPAGRPRRDQMD
jgi:hypothetical protein